MNDIKNQIREENRRNIVVCVGAILVMGFGLWLTKGDAPVYGFFSFCFGILCARIAFRV
jgi:hypothetical protein